MLTIIRMAEYKKMLGKMKQNETTRVSMAYNEDLNYSNENQWNC
jgi:hypothetical protein